jgi:hypothetical protein
MCKIRVCNASEKRSNLAKSEELKGTGMLDLASKGSEESKRGQSKALGGFRKTSELKVDQKSGNIIGWDSLWQMVEQDDSNRKTLESKM